MNKKIYLIRHGKIDIGNEKRYLGITDLSLDHEGIAQAKFLKSYFKQIPIEKIFTSPLTRCLQTTKIICEEKKQIFIPIKEFTEINMGIWENKPISYIKKNFPQAYEDRGGNLGSFIPPEGESFNQLASRVLLAFDSIVDRYARNIMIVAHAGVNRVILSYILGLSIEDIFSIQQPYGCVNELICNDANKKWEYKRLI
ncbi:histidine phosphatase family protein [Marinisporobacter balticus]|nr:histidine phosphatase family protein [Marinisporobacter balticus]